MFLAVAISRVLVFLLVAISCACSKEVRQDMPSERVFENELIDFSECVRKILNEGDPEGSFPSFNPLVLSDIFVDFDDWDIPSIIKGELDLYDVHLDGLTSWNFTELQGIVRLIPPGFTLDFEITIPLLSGHASYFGNVTLLDDYDLGGEFSGTGEVTDLVIRGNITIGLVDDIQVEDFNLDVSVGDVTFVDDDTKDQHSYSILVSSDESQIKDELKGLASKLFSESFRKDAALKRDLIGSILADCLVSFPPAFQ